jgi:hypothetical protein
MYNDDKCEQVVTSSCKIASNNVVNSNESIRNYFECDVSNDDCMYNVNDS